jgi:hypothetical protein
MSKGEPPSCPKSPFLIGRNSHGEWAVLDRAGSAAACSSTAPRQLNMQCLRMNGRTPQAVVMVPGPLELDLTSRISPVREAAPDASDSLRRRAA